MKTFKQLISEVEEPKSSGEKRFKAKHIIKKTDYPIDDEEAKNVIFKGGTEKDDTVPASYEEGEDELVYESASFIEEALKVGNFKLNDGHNAKLNSEEVKLLNNLFSELNATNRRKMEEEMKADKESLDRILKFAKEMG